jgi:hypothetical protein
MILHCSFEELTAVGAVAGRVLGASGAGGVAAPPQVIADIEALSTRLDGDLTVESLLDVRSITRALDYLLNDARACTDSFVLVEGPAAESAIVSYFEHAHLLTLLDRATRMADQMTALIEVMSGQPVTEEAARHFSFPE